MATHIELPKLRLSDLRPSTRYEGVPRRYDETKPAMVQGFTHRNILDLGTSIHRKTLEKCFFEKNVAIKAAEAAVWKQAEALREEALERAAKKAKQDQEKLISKLVKAHERAIREEAIRVEAEMQKIAVEQVQQERRDGERRLAMAVEKTEKRCQEELLKAVAQARDEERKIAADQVAKVLREEQDKLELALQRCAEDKARDLEQLELKLLKQAKEQVAQAHEEEQKIAASKLSHMKSLYEQQIIVLQTQISEIKNEVTRTERDIMLITRDKQAVEAELREIKDEFADFIKRVQPYNKTEPDFIVPPALSPNEFDE